MNGCDEEVTRPVATYAGHAYTRCPRTFVGARELYVVSLARDGFVASLSPMERRRQPAKLMEALTYLAAIAKEARGEH